MFISYDRAEELVKKYGSPLYVYDEKTLRKCCKELHDLVPNKNFRVNYSAKANTNLELLKIINSEDIDVDAMSPGELYMEKEAGFTPDRMFFIGNNVSAEEMQYAIDSNVLFSADSLSQLELFGKINPGGEVMVRFNPGIGAGHNEKVITGGEKTKFGIQRDFIPQVKEIIKKYDLKLVGIDQHIGSHFLEDNSYIDGIKILFEIAKEFPGLKVIDFGGGFGVPYEGEERLDFSKLSKDLDEVITEFLNEYDNKDVVFRVEPGRYISCECGLLIGTIHSIKENYNTKYVGTDIGFTVLIRPMLYDSYHEIHLGKDENAPKERCTVVGNICESGDIIAKDRELSIGKEGELVIVENAGAYGYSMSSNYNCRLRPAEVLIDLDGNDRLIRRRDTFEDLIRGCKEI
jgi:diaminopimelate decarboxylase